MKELHIIYLNDRMKLQFLFLGLFIVIFVNPLHGQDGGYPTKYSSIAQQMVQTTVNGDPNANSLPSVALDNGYGSFLDNPASSALINDSYFSVGYLSNFTNNVNSFQNNAITANNNIGALSNVGLIYRFPTVTGSLVLGGGYTVNNSINRKNNVFAENTRSSITDEFKDPSSYQDIAYETFAIDYIDEDENELASIFRIENGSRTFAGVFQDFETLQQSNIGEFSFFGATEFRKNLYVGISFALISGTYTLRRNMLEQDIRNVYNHNFLFQDDNGNNGTDIEEISLSENIELEIIGASVRAGFLYKVTQFLNIGASYTFPNTLFISEYYDVSLNTLFDDGTYSQDGYYYDEGFNFEVQRPEKLNLGMALVNLNGLSISSSLEIVDHRNTEVKLTIDSDLTPDEIADLRQEEEEIKRSYKKDYNKVMNASVGAKYLLKNDMEIRATFQHKVGKSNTLNVDKNIYSFGFGIPIFENIYLDVSTQYSKWRDRSILYEYLNTESRQVISETIYENISHYKLLLGLKFKL